MSQAWVGPKPSAPIKCGRLTLYGMDHLLNLPKRGYLVKGLLAPKELSLLVGPPKCGKSFLALHVAYAVAQGRKVFGRRVHQERVLYVAAEGEFGIAKRLEALADEYGTTDAFHLIAQRADLLHGTGSNSDLKALTEATRVAGAELVVIDTLARTIAGGDENSSDDMGTFIANVTDLRDATGAHVLIVHHGTKASNGTSPRGHSSLAGAVDAIVEVTKADNGDRLASIAAAKDDPDGVDLGFRLRPVDLGHDADGDPITTLLVEELASAPRLAPRLTQLQRGVREAVTNLIAKHGMALPATPDFPSGVFGVREHTVLTECDARHLSGADSERKRRQTYRQALAALQAASMVAMRDDWVWLV